MHKQSMRDICDLGFLLTLCVNITKEDDSLPDSCFKGLIVIEPYADNTFSIIIGPKMSQNIEKKAPCYSMDLTKEQALALLKHLEHWIKSDLSRHSPV